MLLGKEIKKESGFLNYICSAFSCFVCNAYQSRYVEFFR